ncbi:recombinase family protein [Streptomyces sp. MUSC 14]|uniref:recombinase family protein n=1 Tax=Streptomyces sp. MUSC 14 TaxID=1354889 RepID=UPI0008F5DABF|nr:recombinase family protein [Streptomyces sp. MUSC 14]OIJ88178.1 recombinase family protein [Streptomyces sp. MUSC 14]
MSFAERVERKVEGRHRDRLAVVYVRQSSRQQVVDHGESTRLQYGLAERAVILGWSRSRVLVIDEDLGRSAAGGLERPGFARLVTEITMGRVGVVLGLEMSRLARVGRDWHQLIELCSLTSTLLADVDGVYDPNCYNDRLLLGLKGTMSEVELHLIKQRMAAGRLAKAARGELAVPLPAGYVRRPDGTVALDPDEQIRAVVRLVLDLFEQLGTVHAVLRFLVEHRVLIGMRQRSGPDKGEVVWRRPHQQGLINMLRNPAYAGIYAYGRSRADPARRRPGRPQSGRARGLGESEWLVRIEDALPAYISVEQYERNLARMAANRARAESMGSPREGPALLAGLVVCTLCGQRLQVVYERSKAGLTGRYCCTRRLVTYGEPRCQQMAAGFLDAFVVEKVLAALAPSALELSIEAARHIEARRAEVDRIWRQRLERAGIAAERAARCYRLAEPENRLVVRQLEREWEEALATQAALAEDYEHYRHEQPDHLSAAELAAIRALAVDLPTLWHAKSTTIADRKRLLRCVVERVEVAARGASEQVHATIVWAGGARTDADLTRPVARVDQLSYYPRLVERIRALAAGGLTTGQIADELAAEGLRPPRQSPRFNPGEIQHLIRRLGIRPGLEADRHTANGPLSVHEWWLATLAREIDMPAATLFGWLQRGWVTGRQDERPPHRWIITADPDEIERLKALRRTPDRLRKRRRWINNIPDHNNTNDQGEHGS